MPLRHPGPSCRGLRVGGLPCGSDVPHEAVGGHALPSADLPLGVTLAPLRNGLLGGHHACHGRARFQGEAQLLFPARRRSADEAGVKNNEHDQGSRVRRCACHPLLPSRCDKPSLAFDAVLPGRLPSRGPSVQKIRSKQSANRNVRQALARRLVLNNRNTSHRLMPIHPSSPGLLLRPLGQVACRSLAPLTGRSASPLPAHFSRCGAAWIRDRGGLRASLRAARLRALSGEPVRPSAPSADNKGRRHRTAVRKCLRGRSSLVDLRGRTEGG